MSHFEIKKKAEKKNNAQNGNKHIHMEWKKNESWLYSTTVLVKSNHLAFISKLNDGARDGEKGRESVEKEREELIATQNIPRSLNPARTVWTKSFVAQEEHMTSEMSDGDDERNEQENGEPTSAQNKTPTKQFYMIIFIGFTGWHGNIRCMNVMSCGMMMCVPQWRIYTRYDRPIYFVNIQTKREREKKMLFQNKKWKAARVIEWTNERSTHNTTSTMMRARETAEKNHHQQQNK